MNKVTQSIKNSILVGTMISALLSSASELSSYKANNDNTLKTALTLNNVKVGDLLTIKDNDGTILYKESINVSGNYRKGFDLTTLPKGYYFFEIEKDFEIKTIPFIISNKKVVLYNAKETTTFKPFVKQKGNILYVSKLATNGEALKISIYLDDNSEYELLHTDKIEGIQSIEKSYKLQKGNYKIVLNSNNQEYTKFINN